MKRTLLFPEATMTVFFLLLLAGATLTVNAEKYQRFCYIASWARYRQDIGKFNPEDVGANLCSHIAYAFAELDSTGTQLKAHASWEDPALYTRFTSLKQQDPDLKTLLSVGGWEMGSMPFSKLVHNDSNIQAFATNTVRFLRSHNFDGIDIDWEFPGTRGSPPTDKQRYTRLVQILMQTFETDAHQTGHERLLITLALSADPTVISRSYEAAKLARYVDLMTVMAYDMHGPWEETQQAAHHSALFGTTNDTTNNIDFVAKYYSQNLGVPKSKLMIGVPFYSRTYTIQPGTTHVTGPGRAGNYSNVQSTLAYYEVCQLLKDGATGQYIDVQKVPYLVKHDQWVGYDNEKSIAEKVKYVVDNGYAGISVWALDMDDFRGVCGKAFPLMNAVNNAFNTVIG